MSGAEVLDLATLACGTALFALGGWMWVKYDDGRPVVLMVAGLLLILAGAS